MKSNSLKSLLYFLFVVIFSACFVFFPELKVRFVLKLLPSVVLLLFLLKLKGADKVYMIIALVFCASGDVFLDVSRENLFMGGLISFALAHLIYFIYFLRSYTKPDLKKVLILVILLVYGLVLGWYLKAAPEKLQIPVWIYLGIIILMAMAAVTAHNVHYLLYIGVIVFILSDTVLAINKFIVSFGFATPLNITLYFVSQYCIVMGIVKARAK